jgi:hypothetical protein
MFPTVIAEFGLPLLSLQGPGWKQEAVRSADGPIRNFTVRCLDHEIGRPLFRLGPQRSPLPLRRLLWLAFHQPAGRAGRASTAPATSKSFGSV